MGELATTGLSLAPFRAVRPAASGAALARLLCPPYDVIDADERARLLAGDTRNAVAVVLPVAEDGADPYGEAADLLEDWVRAGHLVVDAEPALYVYEMRDSGGAATRGLVGAVGLHDPAEGVILPHEDTMAGPVADRLALMTATQANVEPIYLVYQGGGAASELVREVGSRPPVAEATTGDGITHRLWRITDPARHAEVAADIESRRALIADGHHRYATYREMQRRYDAERGPGPWDRGLTLLVDSTEYGPQVHAIHRVLPGLAFDEAARRAAAVAVVQEAADLEDAMRQLAAADRFAVVLSDGDRFRVAADTRGRLAERAAQPGQPAALGALDVTVLHRGLIEATWGIADTVESVGYAHSVDEALAQARATSGTAVLLRPTPVAAVAEVAAAGARMPRKSTLFTPKPASGLLIRRFADEQ